MNLERVTLAELLASMTALTQQQTAILEKQHAVLAEMTRRVELARKRREYAKETP